MMYNIIQHAHSGLRWLVLALLIWSVFAAFRGLQSGAAYTDADRQRGFFTMLAAHIQLLLGLLLYFIWSPYVRFSGDMMKDPLLRFYSVEHIFLMLVAIVLITLGYTRSKARTEDKGKFKAQFVFFLIGLLLILIAIPWPFREGLSGSWF